MFISKIVCGAANSNLDDRIVTVLILAIDADDKLESDRKCERTDSSQDPCREQCCPKNADVDNENAEMNETSKEDFSVEEKEKDSTEDEPASSCRETASFRVVWNKKNYEVTFPVDETADCLKQHIENLTGLLLSCFCLINSKMEKDFSETPH